ncbi:MAG TPA: PfkB family carbohydrate kinase [Bryobacteraceae bacterium]|nr:PfkB family carbohydrate kinase [Bryobacteraceae bacterium]
MLTIAGIGEALFDVFPGGRRRLGGAPVNFAVHAGQLIAASGRAIPVSRIGRDALGREIRTALARFGLDDAFLQEDADRPTGEVRVRISDAGEPSYDILRNAAWDAIEYTDDLRRLSASCDAVCFGTLAQRSERSRRSIQQFVSDARRAWRLFDINLRQHFYDASILERGFALASAAKLNEEELLVVARLFQLAPDPEVIRRRFALEHLIYTRGERGTVICGATGVYEGASARFERHPEADSVGAGDACAAAVTVGILSHWPLQQVADFANQVGAYVASQPGGAPELPDALTLRAKPAVATPAPSVS